MEKEKYLGKIIFVIGGVMSGIGKGIVVASIASILKDCNLKVNTIKLDPYLNIDAGTINPFEHGETYVTSDGLESDLDLGHYERFTDLKTTRNSIITSGKIYQNIINKERKGDFLGSTVQMIPHVCNEIIDFIKLNVNDNDITICEIGGTVGDIESMVHMEAIRQIRKNDDLNKTAILFLTYIPYIQVSDEFKTKPAQESIKTLLHSGLHPDIIMCRYENTDIEPYFLKKLLLYSNLSINRIFLAPNVDNIYKLPYIYAEQGIHYSILSILQISNYDNSLSNINRIYNNLNLLQETIIINIIIKYGYIDAYLSLNEAIKHAAYYIRKNIKINWIDVRKMDKGEVTNVLKNNNYPIIIPGGFGINGIENKIEAINYARENNIPILGICYGMQLMAIEFARNVLGIYNANSEEIDSSSQSSHVVHLIHNDNKNIGGTMRLGNYSGTTLAGSFASKIYGEKFEERHRHRYEINTNFREQFEKNGLMFSGISLCGKYTEIIEINNLDFFVGVQFHPEFNTSIFNPNKIILEFIKTSYKFQFKKNI